MRSRRAGPGGAGARVLAAVAATSLAVGTPLRAQDARALARMADSLIPYVEGASGLTFLHRLRLGLRTRAEVRDYVGREFKRFYPPERIAAISVSYHLLGLLPDTAGFEHLLVDLYGEQLRGYCDPATDSLFGVSGTPPAALREVLIHEMVHAVQAQYVDLRAFQASTADNDRRSAAQSLIEGQAMFTTMRLLVPRRNIVAEPNLWGFVTDHIRSQPAAQSAFRRAPLWLREGMLAPYIYGAQFASWWNASALADTLPYGPRLPLSTEQILHFPRYAAGDRPLTVRFAADSGPSVVADNVVGELEIQILAAQLSQTRALGQLRPLGWGGDRYRVYASAAGPALVWYLVWDDRESASSFESGTGARLAARRRPGYQSRLDTLSLGDHPAMRYVFAPADWEGWTELPEAVVASAEGG